MHIRLLVACLLAAAALASTFASAREANEWKRFLQRPDVEAIEISPSGQFLAIAERQGNSTIVTVRGTGDMEALTSINPGQLGEISSLRWLDDDRLLIGANRADATYKVTLVEPALYIIGRDGRSKYMLPGNFVATIKGDPAHLLISRCADWKDDKCRAEIRKAEIGHSSRDGDLIISGPERGSKLYTDGAGRARFAAAWDDDDLNRLHVHRGDTAGWSLLNDEKASGLESYPLGFDENEVDAYLLTERKGGPSVVERYNIQSGQRSDVYRHGWSDPIAVIRSVGSDVPLGAYYDAAAPKPLLWNLDHPDVPILKQVLSAFPGAMVSIVSATNDKNRMVVHVSSDQDPGSYYLFDRAARAATLLARERPWLAGTPLPRSTSFELAARDGIRLHGLLTTPVRDSGKPWPMVVIPHGGPYDIKDIAGYDAEAALLASEGFAVLRVNYRGSGGYGRDFTEAGYKQWGRAMQDDVTDATKWAIAQGVADANRICLYGASYGGYAAMMGAVREPALYRCVASYAAPSNLEKMYKWGSIRRSDLGMSYLQRVLGKDKADLASRSPAKQAASIKVPVLLAHGRLDARVAVEHAKAMQDALRDAGRPADTVLYPKEGHGLAIVEDQIDFYSKLLAFLKTHTSAE